jgi:hypothetical protein
MTTWKRATTECLTLQTHANIITIFYLNIYWIDEPSTALLWKGNIEGI